MYARSTTIEAQPSSIDAGIAHVRDVVMPALTEVDGCVGLSLLVDRGSGRCIATSSWENEAGDACERPEVRPVRDQAAQTFGGSPTVDEWEIAVLHRDHPSGPGAGVRATWLTVRPDQFDRAIEFLPRVGAARDRGPRRLLQREPDDRPHVLAGGVVVDVRQPGGDAAQRRAGPVAADRPASRPRRRPVRRRRVRTGASHTCGCPSWSRRLSALPLRRRDRRERDRLSHSCALASISANVRIPRAGNPARSAPRAPGWPEPS